jgi:hypothetical protein
MLKLLVGDRLLSASKNPTGSADGVFVWLRKRVKKP